MNSPFTPRSDQLQFSLSVSPEIYHTVWRIWHLIACWDESWLNYQFSLHHLCICSWMVRRICTVSLGVKGIISYLSSGVICGWRLGPSCVTAVGQLSQSKTAKDLHRQTHTNPWKPNSDQRQLLLSSYEQLWVVQYGEIGSDLLLGLKFVKL